MSPTLWNHRCRTSATSAHNFLWTLRTTGLFTAMISSVLSPIYCGILFHILVPAEFILLYFKFQVMITYKIRFRCIFWVYIFLDFISLHLFLPQGGNKNICNKFYYSSNQRICYTNVKEVNPTFMPTSSYFPNTEKVLSIHVKCTTKCN